LGERKSEIGDFSIGKGKVEEDGLRFEKENLPDGGGFFFF
jgi:hypothetical protein